MSAPPYMRFFWGDYHKATRHLTRDQHGAYFLLIGEAWRLGGFLPDDDARLAAWALCSPDEWAAMKPTIMDFFAFRRGKWWHDRVREELAAYESTSRKRKQAGKKGGSARRGKITENNEANACQLPTKPEPEPIVEANASTEKRARQRAERLPEDWTPPDDWIAEAVELGLPADRARDQAERMRDWSRAAKAGAKLDWRATWRNWVKRVLDDGDKHGKRTRQDVDREARSAFHGALQQYDGQHEEGSGEPDPGGERDRLRIVHDRRSA